MAKATAPTVSLTKFTAVVQASVKAAIQKHPRFRMDPPTGVSLSYLIRGIPVPDDLLGRVTVEETQEFADDIAAGIGGTPVGRAAMAAGPRGKGAMIFVGGHLILGFPVPIEVVTFVK
jgi:hypothetical protein